MKFVKRSLAGGGTRDGVGVSGGVGALVGVSSLLMLGPLAGLWASASSSCSPVGSGRELTQELRQVQDPGAIARELKSKERDAVLPNGLADLLGMELLEW